MGLFDGGDSYSFSKQFVAACTKLANAAETAAEAYAKKVGDGSPSYVVNINHDGNVHTATDIAKAVTRALNNRGVQDR